MKRLDPPVAIRRTSTQPQSLEELARRIEEPGFAGVRAWYRVRNSRALPMVFDQAGWADASSVLQSVEKQTLVFVQSRHLAQEAVLNPFRARRSGRAIPSDPAAIVDRELAEKGCQWCDPSRWHVSQTNRLIDEFGGVSSADGRFRAGPNWARLSTVSGMVYGDELAHNLFRLTASDFASLFATASDYIDRAKQHRPGARYFVCFLNGGPRSAGSVAHAHVQVVGREDSHFGLAEQVARCCPQDYWQRLADVHEALGLAHHSGASSAWANLCPVKERDVTLTSPDLVTGAKVVFDVLQSLIRNGTTSFSLAAILKPDGAAAGTRFHHDRRFSHWPEVVWRLVDRGDVRSAHADIGALELLGGTAAVATDPWDVARWIQTVKST